MVGWKDTKSGFEQQLELNLREYNGGAYPPHWVNLLFFLDDLINNREKTIDGILDFGCGVGIISQLILDNYPSLKYVGVDSARYAIELGIKNFSNIDKHLSVVLPINLNRIKCWLPVNYPLFFDEDYKVFLQVIRPNFLILVNALCDVLEDGDQCVRGILEVKPDYAIFLRMKVVDSPSYYLKEVVYGEVETPVFYHNKKNLLEIFKDFGYNYSIRKYCEDGSILDIMVEKN